MPPSVQGQSEEGVWLIQVLREQTELLEIILLYYKDYDFLTPDLCEAAKRFQVINLLKDIIIYTVHEGLIWNRLTMYVI